MVKILICPQCQNCPVVKRGQRKCPVCGTKLLGGSTKSKYRNRKTKCDGFLFDSAKEAKRWMLLKAMQEAGEISGLQRQVRFPLIVNGIKICVYIADFVYYSQAKQVVEDAKGMKTALYRLKKKLMLAILDIVIKEV